MTKINRHFDPSPELCLARVRQLSEHWTTPLRKLRTVGVKKPASRDVRVYHPWEGGGFARSWIRDL